MTSASLKKGKELWEEILEKKNNYEAFLAGTKEDPLRIGYFNKSGNFVTIRKLTVAESDQIHSEIKNELQKLEDEFARL